jgi:hypothetical protein
MGPDTSILAAMTVALGIFAMVGVPDEPRSADGTATTAAGVYLSAPAAVEPAPVPLPQAERVAPSHQVADTLPAPAPTTTVPAPVPGDCESWRPVFAYYGADQAALEFFIDGGILRRESGCGLDTLNDDTSDSGICQINPIHQRAGYFGGVEFGTGGWLTALHGLATGIDTDNPAWAAACVTLFEVCGTGPWSPPYDCANRRLEI